jgi:hypothetical protein
LYNAENTPKSPLLSELQNSIYEYAFEDIKLHVCLSGLKGVTSSDRPLVKTLSLLQTCRQIHTETKLLPYFHSTFSVDDSNTLNDFVDSLTSAQLKAIRTIELVLEELPSAFGYTQLKCLAKLSDLRKIDVLVLDDHVGEGIGTLGIAGWRKTTLAHVLRMWRPALEVNIRAKSQDM